MLSFDSLDKCNEHTLSHFQQKKCYTCNTTLLCIAGNWYQMHIDTNCGQLIQHDYCSNAPHIDDDCLDIKPFPVTEITFEPHESIIDFDENEKFINELLPTQVDHDTFLCEICSEIFTDPSELLTHRKQAHNLPRKRGRPSKKAKQKHTIKIFGRKKINELFICDICSMTFKWKAVLKSHMHRIHIKQTVQCTGKCLVKGCRRYFKSQKMYERHIRANELVTCDICQKQIRGKHHMLSHLKKHLARPTEKYLCTICDEEFINEFCLESHMNVHSLINEFKCMYDGCKRVFRFKRKLDDHIEVHEKLLNDPLARALYCKTCDKMMPTKQLFERHKCLKFICYYCGREFKRMSLLKEHLNTHTGEKPYKCNVCEKTFPRYFSLKRHELIHSGKKPYLCQEVSCGQAFNQSSELHRHRFRAHGIYKQRYPCKYCNQVFPENALLRRHLETHEN